MHFDSGSECLKAILAAHRRGPTNELRKLAEQRRAEMPLGERVRRTVSTWASQHRDINLSEIMTLRKGTNLISSPSLPGQNDESAYANPNPSRWGSTPALQSNQGRLGGQQLATLPTSASAHTEEVDDDDDSAKSVSGAANAERRAFAQVDRAIKRDWQRPKKITPGNW